MQLGRYGDILNILPLLYYLNQQGQRQTLLVAKEFGSVGRYVKAYADVEIFPGPFEDYHGACGWGDRRYLPFLKASVYGKNLTFERQTPNFCQEAYHRCHPHFGQMFSAGKFDKIEIDGVSPALGKANCGLATKPILLINFTTRSSPIDNAKEWVAEIRKELREVCSIIDLGTIRAPSLFDLLSIYEMSDFLITADTGTLHLAGASRIPYIALQNDLWGPWYSGYTRGNCVWRVKYSEAWGIKDHVIEMARKALECA